MAPAVTATLVWLCSLACIEQAPTDEVHIQYIRRTLHVLRIHSTRGARGSAACTTLLLTLRHGRCLRFPVVMGCSSVGILGFPRAPSADLRPFLKYVHRRIYVYLYIYVVCACTYTTYTTSKQRCFSYLFPMAGVRSSDRRRRRFTKKSEHACRHKKTNLEAVVHAQSNVVCTK